MQLAQLGGIIRYEALMQFRRRALIVLGVFFLVGMVGLTDLGTATGRVLSNLINVRYDGDTLVTTYFNYETGETTEQTLTPEQAAALPAWFVNEHIPTIAVTWSVLTILAPAAMILFIAIPPLLAETIPLDRQYRVRELLDTLPLSRAVYLAGKVFSVCVGMLLMLIVVGLIFAAYTWFRFGTFDVWIYIRYWLLLIIPFSWIIAGFSVIAAAIARTRRIGVLIGLALIPLSIVITANLIRVSYFSSVLFSLDSLENSTLTYGEIVARMFGQGVGIALPFLGALVGVWGLMWAYLRVRSVE